MCNRIKQILLAISFWTLIFPTDVLSNNKENYHFCKRLENEVSKNLLSSNKNFIPSFVDKLVNEEMSGVIESVQTNTREFMDAEIVERMMIPMCIETALCIEDGIVDSPIEADMGLVLGLGFPAFRGGALRYLDSVGLSKFCEMGKKYSELGELYKPAQSLLDRAQANETYY